MSTAKGVNTLNLEKKNNRIDEVSSFLGDFNDYLFMVLFFSMQNKCCDFFLPYFSDKMEKNE